MPISYPEVNTLIQSKIDRQLQLEDEMVSAGVSRYRKGLDDDAKSETDLPPGKQLVKANIVKIVAAIQRFIEEASSGKAGRRHSCLAMLEVVDPYVAAYVALRGCLDAAARHKPLQYCLLLIGANIKEHLDMQALTSKAPGYVKKVEMDLNARTSNAKHRKAVFRRAARKVEAAEMEWSDKEQMSLGNVLFDMVEMHTGLVERVRTSEGRNDTPILVLPTKECDEWLRDGHVRAELLHPYYMPMIVPPKRWTNPFNGGYLSAHRRGSDENPRRLKGFGLVKTFNKNYLTELKAMDMPQVYDAINSVQETAWRINKSVLNVMKTVWESGGSLGGLPPCSDLPLPKRPAGIPENIHMDDLEESVKSLLLEWKAEAANTHAENARIRSKRLSVAHKLMIAERYADEEELYFPHQLDWRGRVYPVTVFVNPQSDDSGKALLEFAQGKPLGDGGAYWLAVHISNLFGVDKVPFDDRVAWVMAHEEAILDSAMNPLDGKRFWTEADSPYCALAACFEWAGYRLEGDTYVSHIPVAMDGSCSGLQHFSAMLRDPIGGAAVNLLPSDRPADIYTQVAKVAQGKVDAMDDAEARLWHGNKVVRKIAKQPCMTLCYGASLRGMQDQVKVALRKLDAEGSDGETYLDTDSNHAPSRFMGKIVRESIGEVVVAAKEAMDWLQEVARLASSNEMPVRWSTPVGFQVLQEYKTPIGTRVNVFFSGQRVQLVVAKEGDKLDKKQQASGISPNFVHSLDASHLMATVNTLVANGVTSLACIHDSFGTHAADIEVLHKAVRMAFVEQYTPDVLARFRDEIASQLPPELAEKIPSLPRHGTLDIASIMGADYAFA